MLVMWQEVAPAGGHGLLGRGARAAESANGWVRLVRGGCQPRWWREQSMRSRREREDWPGKGYSHSSASIFISKKSSKFPTLYLFLPHPYYLYPILYTHYFIFYSSLSSVLSLTNSTSFLLQCCYSATVAFSHALALTFPCAAGTLPRALQAGGAVRHH
jgi:hypothetical protein